MTTLYNTLGNQVDKSVAMVAAPGKPVLLAPIGGTSSERTLAFLGGLMLAAEVLIGTNAYAAPEPLEMRIAVHGRWTNNGIWNSQAIYQVSAHRPVYGQSLRDSVLLLHEMSGLTWDQLAKLFGVSRRAVHLWASGGRMNSAHVDRLNEVLSVIRSIQGDTVEQRREFLLAPRADGRSLYEGLLASRRRGEAINAPAFRPEQLTEALHDR